MKVIEILAMNEEIEHVVALTANLETSFDPVDPCGLEELCSLEGTEQVLLCHGLWRTMLEFVQDEAFKELLVRHPDFSGLARWTMLKIPAGCD